jgi:hypothetical protein
MSSTLRLHLTGWLTQPTIQELSTRIKVIDGIGKVNEIIIPTSSTRYAHAEIEIKSGFNPDDIILGLQKIYRGTKWKGGTLLIDIAKPGHLQRLEEIWTAVANNNNQTTTIEHSSSNSFNEEDGLRIRKKRGKNGVIIVKPSKSKRIRFATTTTITTSTTAQSLSSQKNTVAEQCLDLSYCCTSGDAGSGTNITNSESEDEINNDQSLDSLASFVKSQLLTIPVKIPSSSNDSSSSLLGKFRRLNTTLTNNSST